MPRTSVQVIPDRGTFWIRVETSAGTIMGSLPATMTVRDAIAERRRVAAFYAGQR